MEYTRWKLEWKNFQRNGCAGWCLLLFDTGNRNRWKLHLQKRNNYYRKINFQKDLLLEIVLSQLKFSSPMKKVISLSLFILSAMVVFGQRPKTCIDSLMTNPEYGLNKKFTDEVAALRKQGFTDNKIFDLISAEAEKEKKELEQAANAQFIKDYILNKKVTNTLSPNAYYCHADSLGLMSASSMGNWQGFSQGWCNNALCTTAPWTPVKLPCNSCI